MEQIINSIQTNPYLKYLLFHTVAFGAGVVLDFIIGDPYKLPHPVRLIGKLINSLDRHFMGDKANISSDSKKEFKQGIMLAVIVILIIFLLTGSIITVAYLISAYAGIIIEAILTFYILAAKSLYKESMKVYKALKDSDIEKARYNVSMIVGRDTKSLDEEGIAKAAVETVAENTSDGIVAPMIYTALFGPVGGMIYKGINTMDSMVGYHNDRYEYLGKCPAVLDDIVNYIPSRLSAVYMIIASFILSIFSKRYSGIRGFKIWKRDRRNHKSPNSAQTESVCAGSLGLKLAGPASYFGKLHDKPYIGDMIYPVTYKDIKRAGILMFITEAVCFCIYIIIASALILN